MKNIRIFYLKIFLFLVVKFSIYLNRHVFVMIGLSAASILVDLYFAESIAIETVSLQRFSAEV